MKNFNKFKSAVLFAVAAYTTPSILAQIAIDMSNATLTKVSPTGFQIDNLSVPRFGNYQVAFQWNPNTLKFDLIDASITSNGSTCTSATMTGSASSNSNNVAGYRYFSRSDVKGEFGGIQVANSFSSGLTLSWAKTTTAAQNPYLTGRTLANFDASKAYGVIGNISTFAYPGGFVTGDLVEITGGPLLGAVSILKTGTSASIALTLASASSQGSVPVVRTINCLPTSNGITKGNMNVNSNNNNYALSFFGANAGSLAPASVFPSAFNANWGNFSAPASFVKSNVAYGTVGDVSQFAYENFISNQVVFVADIGGGVSVTTLDNQGKTVGTAVFYK